MFIFYILYFIFYFCFGYVRYFITKAGGEHSNSPRYIFVFVDEVLIKKIKISVQDFRDEDPQVQVGIIIDPNISLKNVNPCRLKIFFWPIE